LSKETDEFQRRLDFIVERAEQLIDRNYAKQPQLRGGSLLADRFEVIEDMDSILVVIDASRMETESLQVEADGDELKVRWFGGELVQRLPSMVESGSQTREERNGVVTVRFMKPL
jgi:hypothetical protein